MGWGAYAWGTAVPVVMLLAAAGSFFFALAESALFALGKWRARQLADTAPERAAKLMPLFESPQDLLAAIILGNTLANGALIGIAVWAVAGSSLHQALFIPALFLFILIGCEAIPKTLGVRAPEFWSMRVAPAMRLVIAITRPFRQIAQRANLAVLGRFVPKSVERHSEISEQEYPDLLEIARQQGALTLAEKEMILQVLSLDQKTARDVMKPRSTLACIPGDLPREEMVAAARKFRQARLPVYDETPDTIVGILDVRTFLLRPEAELDEVLEFPSFVPESMNLVDLLRSLRRQRRELAIVLNEFGGVAGLVTREDILEAMLGKFRRRDAREFSFEKKGAGRWRVSGTCLIEEFRREHPALHEVPEVDTMGGLLVRQLEYVPAAGESVMVDGLRLTARRVEERRVRELSVEVAKG